jgi:hypothetical protein
MMKEQMLQSALADLFAPWVQALGLKVESLDAESVTLRLPQDPQLSRVGGMLCGQAMMAAADTAMVLALINRFGEFKPCTTMPWCRRGWCARASRLLSGKSTSAAPTMARARAAPASLTHCCDEPPPSGTVRCARR